MNKYLLILIGILIAYILYMFIQPIDLTKMFNFNKESDKYIEVKIKDKTVKMEVAKTQVQKTKGLMFRKKLDRDKGMLFVFDHEGKHSFWMANTYIPLDIIWINRNKEIVYINENTPSCGNDNSMITNLKNTCRSYTPSQKALYVIELNAGWVKKNDINIGDKVSFELY